jgi:SAM-dependent methyltransferase
MWPLYTHAKTHALPGAKATEGDTRYYKKDFWSKENPKYTEVHYRLAKCARIVNKLAGMEHCELLDVGCGPASLRNVLRKSIQYHGIDIAIQDPAPYLIEADILQAPIAFGDKLFDIVVAQGLFEYLGEFQREKLSEIAQLLQPGGTFVVSYVNFGHRDPQIYWPYSNVRSLADFRASLERDFVIHRHFPTSHNWRHSEPNRRLVRAVNMHLNVNIPVISPRLAVEYFFICSARRPPATPAGSTSAIETLE